jgi:hypothetical protein
MEATVGRGKAKLFPLRVDSALFSLLLAEPVPASLAMFRHIDAGLNRE